jgi:hypothetical protein
VAATHAGITTDEFTKSVLDWQRRQSEGLDDRERQERLEMRFLIQEVAAGLQRSSVAQAFRPGSKPTLISMP